MRSGCHAIVRTMPNTPALSSDGATALFGGSDKFSIEQRNRADSLLARRRWHYALVKAMPKLDAATALSGSGPAYFFLIGP